MSAIHEKVVASTDNNTVSSQAMAFCISVQPVASHRYFDVTYLFANLGSSICSQASFSESGGSGTSNEFRCNTNHDSKYGNN
eukprot:4213892-Amphidinium_carterae.1